MAQPFGFLNAFKPPGISSAQLGSRVKRLAGGTPVGHWGTLDPTACGVLVLAVGNATRLLPLLTDARKSYVFELVAGERTDSGDASGSVLERSIVQADWAHDLARVATSMIGPLEQTPPMHSAIKVDGQPLYRAARAGQQIRRQPRIVQMYDLHPIAVEDHRARLFVTCDAGTYIRVLCEEIGHRLGLPARMGGLLRVAAGPFKLNESLGWESIRTDLAGSLIDPLRILSNPCVDLDPHQAGRFMHGESVRLDGRDTVNASPAGVALHDTVLLTRAGRLIGFGTTEIRDGVTMVAPARVLTQTESPQGTGAEEANE